METENNLHMNMLIQSLQLLAANYEQQTQALPAFVAVPYEVASTFIDDTYLFVNDLTKEGLITADQRAELEKLAQVLAHTSQDEDVLTLPSLQTSPQWDNVRLLAGSILTSFHTPKQPPNLFWIQYYRG